MGQGWESEARSWARFARTPRHDHVHEDVNLPALLELLPPPLGLTLDLGCGEGRLGRVLQKLGYTVTGVDAAPTMVELAASYVPALSAVVGDAAALPFRDETFDLVVAYMSLHDMDPMSQAVCDTARVLRPRGRLCVAIPHPLSSAGGFPTREPEAPFIITGSYLDASPVTWTSDRDGIAVTFHSEHRPLGDYSEALEKAGLLIEAIREVRPPARAVAEDPAEHRWRRIPAFLQIRAVKLGAV